MGKKPTKDGKGSCKKAINEKANQRREQRKVELVKNGQTNGLRPDVVRQIREQYKIG